MPKNNTVTVGWFGDTHVGYRQYGLERRWRDFHIAYKSAVADMIAQGVDFIIHTGDLLNSPRPAPEDISVLQEVEEMLVASETQMFVLAGQHDGLGQNWVEIVKRDTRSNYGYYCMESGEALTVAGIDLVAFNHTSPENLRRWFQVTTCRGQILMLHQALQGFLRFPMLGALNLEELPLDRFDVIAIGDLHIHDIRKTERGIVGYAGSTEMASESEPEGKAWVKLTFLDNKLSNCEPYHIHSRPVVRLNLKTEADIAASMEQVKILSDNQIAAGETRGAIVFVEYNSLLTKVHERFLSAFDPDDFVLRFKPRFNVKTDGKSSADLIMDTNNLTTIEDLRKAEVPDESAISAISQALFNPDMDATAALNAFIDKRLAGVAAE